MHEGLNQYEAMCQLTDLMVVAARDNDWDRLGSLEREVAGIRDRLMHGGDDSKGLDESQRERKRELILRMLDHDREIRRHTEPWMASMRKLLAGSNLERTLRKTYGTEH